METELIAIAIGGYAIAVGVALIVDQLRIDSLLDGLRGSAALAYVTGVFVYFFGALVLIVHLRWDGWLEALVTLIGLGAVIEGVWLFIAPEALIGLGRRLVRGGSGRIWGIASVAFGLLLVIGGFARLGAV